MNEDRLTNYDKHMLARQRGNFNNGNGDKRKEEVKTDNSLTGYENYLINELRRTTPSDKKVLSENEYLALQNGEAVCMTEGVVREEKRESGKSRISKFLPPFRKYGKIILVVYVIIMVAIASILIATNLNGSGLASDDNAGAMSSISKGNVPDGTIRPMSIEDEETDESNWFDRLCDSLNK